MSGRWTTEFSFSGAAVRRRDFIYLLASNDEMREDGEPNSTVAVWRSGKWGWACSGWQSTCLAVCTVPKEQVIAVGEDGEAYLAGSGDTHEESVKTPQSSPQRRGYLRCVRTVEGRAYIAGMNRQVYRRDGENRYTAMDQGARPPAGSTGVVGFEGIDGFSAKEIYAAGWDGEIWFFNGSVWLQANSPVSTILTDVCCAGDEYVYICGRQGTLLRGRGNEWEQIAQDSTKEDLWSLAWYKGSLYASSLRALYRLRRGKLDIVEFDDDIPDTFYHLATGDGILVSTGSKDAMMFDGRSWTRID